MGWATYSKRKFKFTLSNESSPDIPWMAFISCTTVNLIRNPSTRIVNQTPYLLRTVHSIIKRLYEQFYRRVWLVCMLVQTASHCSHAPLGFCQRDIFKAVHMTLSFLQQEMSKQRPNQETWSRVALNSMTWSEMILLQKCYRYPCPHQTFFYMSVRPAIWQLLRRLYSYLYLPVVQ